MTVLLKTKKKKIGRVILCVYKAKINQTSLVIIHHQSFNPVFIRHTLSIIRRHAENTLRYHKDNISAAVCHHKALDGNLCQQTV